LQQGHLVHHHIQQEPLSVRERMSSILCHLQAENQIPFYALWTNEEGRKGLVVSFLAVLELARQSLLTLVQTAPGSPIYILAIENAS
jgi:segregation and condensation protein A